MPASHASAGLREDAARSRPEGRAPGPRVLTRAQIYLNWVLPVLAGWLENDVNNLKRALFSLLPNSRALFEI